MSYLLDTNVISEIIKTEPNPNVGTWFKSLSISMFFLSVITLGEIRKGVEKLPDSKKRQFIINWLEIDLPKIFLGRIINIDSAVSDKWGFISAKSTIPAVDGLIAACALVHNHKLVTRNLKDFINIPGLELLNPWDM
jgi:predicted nucleic acid-binding protein